MQSKAPCAFVLCDFPTRKIAQDDFLWCLIWTFPKKCVSLQRISEKCVSIREALHFQNQFQHFENK